jgi:hypothetical protein
MLRVIFVACRYTLCWKSNDTRVYCEIAVILLKWDWFLYYYSVCFFPFFKPRIIFIGRSFKIGVSISREHPFNQILLKLSDLQADITAMGLPCAWFCMMRFRWFFNIYVTGGIIKPCDFYIEAASVLYIWNTLGRFEIHFISDYRNIYRILFIHYSAILLRHDFLFTISSECCTLLQLMKGCCVHLVLFFK